jgi:ABC-2 type transport system ATP-binding protein
MNTSTVRIAHAMRSAGMLAIEARGLAKEFGRVPVLLHVDLSVTRGSVCALLGDRGSGKTTVLNILSGQMRPARGEAFVCGVHVTRDGGRAAGRAGLMPQKPRFFDWMTGRETLQYTGRFFNLSAARIDDRATDLLDLVGLSAADERRIETYTDGMRQRVGIARALMGGPEVLLLDEPASLLDPAEREAVLNIIARLRGGVTVLFSARTAQDAERVADQVVLLEHGCCVAQSSGARHPAGLSALPPA